MNYKETLFFIGKCLTINYEEHNRILVEKELKSGTVDWDNVVRVSTGQFVFPALYCNLKKANFLDYVPADLVEYMQHITDLNRERNDQIIAQAKEINALLLANNITPIFLKGTGNLLEGLYDDIAERMVGDIDFLVKESDCHKAFDILTQVGYNKLTDIYTDHRHLPRLIHENRIGAVEIHRKILKDKASNSFNYKHVIDSIVCLNDISIISYENQIKLSVFAKLINDDSYQIKSISMRSAYDVFSLFYKKKADIKLDINDNLFKELNAGLLLYSKVLNKPKKMLFIDDDKSINYVNQVIFSLNKSKKNQSKYYLLMDRFKIILRAFYKKDYLIFILKKITDINWYKRRFKI